MLLIYTALMFALVHRSFELIADLPNWVFEWIGGTPRDMGEKTAHQTHVVGAIQTGKQTAQSATQNAIMQERMKGNADLRAQPKGAGVGQTASNQETSANEPRF